MFESDISSPYTNPTQLREQIYKVIKDSIEIKFYPVSDTTGDPTLSLKING